MISSPKPKIGSQKWLDAIERGDRVSTYAIYLDYLVSDDAKMASLSCQQFADHLIQWLADNGHTDCLRKVTDACLRAERWRADVEADLEGSS